MHVAKDHNVECTKPDVERQISHVFLCCRLQLRGKKGKKETHKNNKKTTLDAMKYIISLYRNTTKKL